ncbi:hypothetical protein CFN78_11475 [Amycolatopsis antarctica]|uniref:Uncharacterized protein n=1 Tax=Amycolatopsis antarctica TaxID=1854586 RepID=A0A263D348_9PSEU|nr:hypothetical protein [Amycolatopsis antarctica]OZM72880.1 hypothetical protein CFN78_11475 [Amycolatopsis antarctica]
MSIPTSTAGGSPQPSIRPGNGEPVPIIASYPPWQGLQLHSLAVAVEFRCGPCGLRHESAMVATSPGTLVCPSCYARLSLAAAPVPAQRSAVRW